MYIRSIGAIAAGLVLAASCSGNDGADAQTREARKVQAIETVGDSYGADYEQLYEEFKNA
jgi:hypothetical protein